MDAQIDTKLIFKNELKKHSEIMGRKNFSDLHFINGFSSGVEILAKVLMDKNPSWMIIETVRSTATELLSHAVEAVLSESERIR